MSEIWKDIIGFEGLYQVSQFGNVRSLNYNHTSNTKNLSIKHHHTGYKFVTLCGDNIHKNMFIHRLVACAFIPNPNNVPCVNHIDGDKSNNTVSNLEWMTYKENTRHAIETGLRKDTNMRGKFGALHPSSKPVIQCTRAGELVKTWDCISDAARAYGKNPCTIINCCAGRAKSCAGYVWKYPD